MEFNEKLQELRKQKGLTQEELSEILFVSRTAVSKWESGRGYPNIDSLKAIASFFKVSIDELLSNEEILDIAEKDTKQKEKHFQNIVFGLLDCSVAMLFFLPFFRQSSALTIQEASLFALSEIAPYLKAAYFAVILAIIVTGILILTMQNCESPLWVKIKNKLSLTFNSVGILLFIISLQPYAAVLLFIFLTIKALILIKWQ